MPRKKRVRRPIDLDQATFGPRLILDQPECAKLVGAITLEWERIRGLLPLIYAMLAVGKRPGSGPTEMIAIRTLESLDSTPLRCRIIRSAAQLRLDPFLYERFASALGRLEQKSGNRNLIVHGTWMESDKYPGKLLLTKDHVEVKLHDEKTLLKELEGIESDFNTLWRLFWDEIAPVLEVTAKADILWYAEYYNREKAVEQSVGGETVQTTVVDTAEPPKKD